MLKIAAFLALCGVVFCASNQDPKSYGLIAPSFAQLGRNLVLAGGYDGFSEHDNVWSFPLLADNFVESSTELKRLYDRRSFATSNVFKDYMFTFGGNSSRLELHQLLSGDEHIFYEGNAPHPRVGHSATIRDQELYIYGGYDLVHEEFSDHFWKADLRNGYIHWELLDIEAAPGARGGHTSILYQESLYIFGGQNEEGYFNDVWRFDFNTGVWVRAWVWDEISEHPIGRVGHTGLLWTDETYVIFGGYGTDENGETRFLNDMWAFDLQLGVWEKIFEGTKAGFADYSLTTPCPRAFAAHGVLEGELIIIGGQITSAGSHRRFWSPKTRWIDVPYPEDFAFDAWKYNFYTNEWDFIKCFNASGHGHATNPAECRSSNQPVCPNDCSGNGVCVSDALCECRGEWSGSDCSINPCAAGFDGYELELLDRILISESILTLGQKLASLRSKLQYIQEYLPEFEDFVTVVRSSPAIAVMLNKTDPHAAILFNQDVSLLLPIIEEFNVVLESDDVYYPDGPLLANPKNSFFYPNNYVETGVEDDGDSEY